HFAPHMSAYDPKRTSQFLFRDDCWTYVQSQRLHERALCEHTASRHNMRGSTRCLMIQDGMASIVAISSLPQSGQRLHSRPTLTLRTRRQPMHREERFIPEK